MVGDKGLTRESMNIEPSLSKQDFEVELLSPIGIFNHKREDSRGRCKEEPLHPCGLLKKVNKLFKTIII